MLNIDGTIVAENDTTFLNRGFLYGDAVFETFRISDGKVLFLEDHYFRLMSAMRIVRMEIPMNFTMEYIEIQIKNLIGDCGYDNARARMTVYRNADGLYNPASNEVSFVISASELDSQVYRVNQLPYEIELYKDSYVPAQLISNVKTTNRIINITGSIFASENGFDNCLLLNERRNVVEALNGNVFIHKENILITPPLSEGCLNGIMRKQVMEVAQKIGILAKEEVISTFDLQKADAIFLTNVIVGIQPVTKYRKKEYGNDLSIQLTNYINSELIK